jgi:hypothetical protein
MAVGKFRKDHWTLRRRSVRNTSGERRFLRAFYGCRLTQGLPPFDP